MNKYFILHIQNFDLTTFLDHNLSEKQFKSFGETELFDLI